MEGSITAELLKEYSPPNPYHEKLTTKTNEKYFTHFAEATKVFEARKPIPGKAVCDRESTDFQPYSLELAGTTYAK